MSFSAQFPENQHQSSDYLDFYELRARFHRIFPHGWDFIVKETREAPWKTIRKYKLTESKFWYKYNDPDQILGIRFGQNTRYGFCDLDWGSAYHPQDDEAAVRALKGELETVGITKLFFVQSSESGGLHLYFVLDRPVNSFRLACVMSRAAENAELTIKRGQLETFPNTKRFNRLFQGHRLPLQQGSYLLDKDYVPYSDRLEDFLAAAEWSAAGNDTDLLESHLEEAYEWFKAKKNQERVYQPTPEDKEFVEQVEYAQRDIKEGFLGSIRLRIEEGFTGEGETNELLLTIAKLGRILHGLSGQAYLNYIQDTVVSCPGYARYCRHKHEINRRCGEVAKYGETQWFPYRSKLPENRPTYQYIKNALGDLTNLNHERQYNARCRIIEAVDYIEEHQGGLPQKVGECKLAIRNVTKELFGVSVSDATLKKTENLGLWHPKYRETPVPRDEQPLDEVEPNGSEMARANADDKHCSSDIPQEILPPEPPLEEQQGDRSTPLEVVRKPEGFLTDLKPSPCLDLQKTVQTLALMKGVGLVCLGVQACVVKFVFQILQRAYCDALIYTPGLELLYLGFNGRGANGFVEFEDKKRAVFQVILPNSEVEIFQEYLHSSYFRENPTQMLVYIKPIKNSQNWCNGIAVLIEHLFPIRITQEPSTGKDITTENLLNSSKSNQTYDNSSLYPKILTDGKKLL